MTSSSVQGCKVLHITNWYPNLWNENEALFVREQFLAVEPLGFHRLAHVQVREKPGWPRLNIGSYSPKERYIILSGPFHRSRIVELLTLCLLLMLRLQLFFSRYSEWRTKWDSINVHVAWPLMRFPNIIGFIFGRNILISEHWSAYHFEFNLPKESKGRKRLARIFERGFPITAVSEALAKDIRNFCDHGKDLEIFIVPNVVDPDIFFPRKTINNPEPVTFLMVGAWAPLKRPFLVLNAFAFARKRFPDITLRIVGYGRQWQAMCDYVNAHDLGAAVTLLGALRKDEIAEEMRAATAFLHPSEYETFSVVCAEALCCGVPVIASNVGGIPEFINNGNGTLVENTQTDWNEALCGFLEINVHRDNYAISREATERFSPNSVGKKLASIHRMIIDRVR